MWVRFSHVGKPYQFSTVVPDEDILDILRHAPFRFLEAHPDVISVTRVGELAHLLPPMSALTAFLSMSCSPAQFRGLRSGRIWISGWPASYPVSTSTIMPLLTSVPRSRRCSCRVSASRSPHGKTRRVSRVAEKSARGEILYGGLFMSFDILFSSLRTIPRFGLVQPSFRDRIHGLSSWYLHRNEDHCGVYLAAGEPPTAEKYLSTSRAKRSERFRPCGKTVGVFEGGADAGLDSPR